MAREIHQKVLPSQSGITIIEVIISVSLLAVGILGLLQAFPRGIDAGKSVELTTVAEQLAQEKIEELMAANYDSLPAGTLENQLRISPDPANPFYKFKRSSAVELLDSSLLSSGADVGFKKIIVTIYWPGVLGGVDRSIQLVHLKAKR